MDNNLLNYLRELVVIYTQQVDGINNFLSQTETQIKGATAQLTSLETKIADIKSMEGFSLEEIEGTKGPELLVEAGA